MAFAFHNYLFNLFPPYFKEVDTYKDEDGRGLFERYLSIFEDELDNELVNKIGNYLDDLFDLESEITKFIGHIAYMMGNPPELFNDDVAYKRFLFIVIHIYKTKGTLESYKLMFKLFGYDTVIINENIEGAFLFDADPVQKFDDNHFFDLTGRIFNKYDLFIEDGVVSPDEELIMGILSLIEPIDAKMNEWFFAGQSLYAFEFDFIGNETITGAEDGIIHVDVVHNVYGGFGDYLLKITGPINRPYQISGSFNDLVAGDYIVYVKDTADGKEISLPATVGLG